MVDQEIIVSECPKCGCKERTKNGRINNRPRYRCRHCKCDYTVAQKSTAKSVAVKRLALQMYLEGLGFRSIGRILKVSHVSVQDWIEKYGKQAEELRSDEVIEVVEMDEMHSYIGQKRPTSGYGLLLIDAGSDSSTSYWVKGTRPAVKSSGAG